MKLHRANGNDWDEVTPAEWNSWQRNAARTHGYLTPGNAVTLLGGILALIGVYVFVTDGNHWLALTLMLFGRLADLLDGIVADRTGTKSPIGEAVDATADKFVLAVGIVALWLVHLLPTIVLGVLALHGAYTVLLFAWAHYSAQRLHPSRGGKLATTLEWLLVLLFAAGYSLPSGIARALSIGLAWLAVIGFAFYASSSSLAYTSDLRIAKDKNNEKHHE